MASEEYQKAKRRGEKEYRRAVAEGKYPYLPALSEFVTDEEKLQKVTIGHVTIPVDMIVGTKTVGRQNAFSSNFMPLMGEKTEFAMKWDRLYESQMEEGIRESIRVVEYMKKFYVVEGNKRVSIMKFLGMKGASAEVTRLLPMKTEDPEVKLYYEFTEFYKVAPIYEVTFSKNGSYRRFAELLGQDFHTPWPEELLLRIKSTYTYFTKLFYDKGGKQLSITPGDALLIYLNVYTLDSLVEESAVVLQTRMEKLLPEFAVESRAVELIEMPEEGKSGGWNPLSAILRKTYTKEHPLVAAFMYETNPERSSWLYGHILGQNYVESCFGGVVKTLTYMDCGTDMQLRTAVDEAIEAGAEVIFTTTSRLLDETLRCALHFPKVRFLNCSVNKPRNAVRTYYARMYEAKFLMGVLAATLSEGHKIGYVADMPVYGTIANINAFALGAALADPYAEVELSWYKAIGNDWQKEMKEKGISVISGPDLIRPEHASREYGLFRVMPDDAIHNLAVPMIDWGKYYEQILQTILDDEYDSLQGTRSGHTLNYWWGMSAGVVDVILSGHLNYRSRKLMDLLRREIVQGLITPFDGAVYAQSGKVKGEEDVPFTASEIITMDFLADNVVGRIPAADELEHNVQETIREIGIGQD